MTTKKINVMRYNPEKDSKPYMEIYNVPSDNTTSILDSLCYIKDNLVIDIAYRWSCRMAICGSCGVMINGIPKLACKTFLRDYKNTIYIEALENFPIERDLIVDMTQLFNDLKIIKPYIISNKNKKTVNLQTPSQMKKYHRFSGCINCGLCYSACPQVALNKTFLGPAVITLAHRYNLDNRDHGKKERIPLLNTENGVWNCTFVGYCSVVCPKNVDPAAAIQQSKIEITKDYFSILK